MAGWERARPPAPLLMDIVHKMVCKRAAWSCVRQGRDHAKLRVK